jgi:hypothetical protein
MIISKRSSKPLIGSSEKREFELGDLVLKWDSSRKDRGKHNKFEAL